MTERKANELLGNIHGARRAIDAVIDPGRTRPIAHELDAWTQDIGQQFSRGKIVFRARHLDDAHEQVSIIRSALELGDDEDFLAVSRVAVEKLGKIRETARADTGLPGTGEDIRPRPTRSSHDDDDDDRKSRAPAPD